MKVLLICQANACRGPFAEQLVRTIGPRQVDAVSAGTHADPGGTASWQSIVAARAHGLDLSVHRRQPVRPDLIESADRIYVFDRRQRQFLTEHYPDVAARAALLGEIRGGPGGEIPDPQTGSAEDLDLCYQMIDIACRALVADISHAADPPAGA